MAFGFPAWIFIAILVVVILAILFKTMNQVYLLSILKNNFFYFFIVLLVAFAVYSVIRIHTSYDFDYTTADGLKELGKVYYLWLANIFSNIGKVTGYAIGQDWVVTNSTSEGE